MSDALKIIEFMLERTNELYEVSASERAKIHDLDWQQGEGTSEKVYSIDGSYTIADQGINLDILGELTNYWDVFLSGYIISIINNRERDWHKVHKEILIRDFLDNRLVSNWMMRNADQYPKIIDYILNISHIRYLVINYIEKELL